MILDVIKYTSSFDIQVTFIKWQKVFNGTNKYEKIHHGTWSEGFENSFIIIEIVHRKVDEKKYKNKWTTRILRSENQDDRVCLVQKYKYIKNLNYNRNRSNWERLNKNNRGRKKTGNPQLQY